MKKAFLLISLLVAQLTVCMAQAEYLPTIQPGTKAPDFTAMDTLGVKHSLKDFRGKYVVVDFWASWCGDCRREIPALISLYNDYKDYTFDGKEVAWLGVSFDTDKGAWSRYLSTTSCPWLQISELKKMKESPIAKKYGISWIPSIVLIDPAGNVCERFITAEAVRKSFETHAGIIPLPKHSEKRGDDIMTTLQNRRTDRQYEDRSVNLQDQSDILWSAVGINRDNGNITSPTAMNRQEILVYAFSSEGVYLYDAKHHLLKVVAHGDHRPLVAGRQENFNTAPFFLVFVGDMNKFQSDGESARFMVYADAGIAAENVNVFCASVGIKTCIRATMNSEGIRQLLHLSERQIPMLNTAIGY